MVLFGKEGRGDGFRFAGGDELVLWNERMLRHVDHEEGVGHECERFEAGAAVLMFGGAKYCDEDDVLVDEGIVLFDDFSEDFYSDF